MGLLLAATISCLVAYPGCEWPPEPTQAAQPAPSIAQFAVSFERSGGLKADPRSLEIAPGRQATARGLGKTVHFRVGVKPVRRLRKALEGAGFAGHPGPEAEQLRRLLSTTTSGTAVTRSNSASWISPKAGSAVVDQLEALIDSHLPFH